MYNDGNAITMPYQERRWNIMRKIMLVMHRRVLAQSLVNLMRDDPEREFFAEYIYENAPMTAEIRKADEAVIEMIEGDDEQIGECIDICRAIKAAAPECRLLLMCPENSSDGRHAAEEARRSGLIDDYVFYDASLDYLISKLDSMS